MQIREAVGPVDDYEGRYLSTVLRDDSACLLGKPQLSLGTVRLPGDPRGSWTFAVLCHPHLAGHDPDNGSGLNLLAEPESSTRFLNHGDGCLG